MKDLSDIWAKSINYGSITLLDHTIHVVDAIILFAQKYSLDFDVELAKKGAVLHDLGKAHPHFQRKIKKINGTSLIDEFHWDFIHRHEISSLGFLSCFPKEEWDILIDLVIGHHKSIVNDPKERGILDLMRFRETIDNHLRDWDNWSQYGLQILEYFGYEKKAINYDEAKMSLNYVASYCKLKPNGYSSLRGLLKSADHFASAFIHDTKEKLNVLFQIPDLSFYFNDDRSSSLYPLSLVSVDDKRTHTLVVAPTGAGKTDFLLKRCKGRVFYTLPFQASINAMWERIKETTPQGQDVRLLHATSKIVAGKNNLEEQILQPFPGAAVKVLTPHQLSAIVFGTSGFESVMLDIKGTDVILDEIHTYSGYVQAMVLEIVKALLRLDCRIHIGTATMPSILYNEVKQILGENDVYEVSLPDDILDSFDRHKIDKLEDDSTVIDILENAFNNKEKVLLVYNTVQKAQHAYNVFLNHKNFTSIPKMLIHSRFKRIDRVERESDLKDKYNKDDEFRPCLVISTQVVEVSLDISFDRMITECAPIDSMIQRFGRINRKRVIESERVLKPIHIIAPKGNVLPYKMDVLRKSFDELPSNFEVLKERSLQQKIDHVYPELDIKEIAVHLIHREDRYILKELTDNPKGILIDALEIESATCILESDRDKYLTSTWEERQQLEIPVNYRSIAKHKQKYEQLEVGSYPFVVPQNQEDYNKSGLQLVEFDTFL